MNLSLGSSTIYNTQCAGSAYSAAFKAARDVGVLAAVAAGNSGAFNGLSSPACAPEAVSVGATFDAYNPGWCPDSSADAVTCFSNNANYLTLLAPGCTTTAGEDASGAPISMCGTSMASPHVAGAIAVLKGAVPGATSAQVVQALQESGKPVADYRDLALVKPRLSLKAAVERLKALVGGTGPPDTTAPTATLAINAGALKTATGTVRLGINGSDASAITQMCVRNSADAPCTVDADWEAFAPTKATWQLAAGADGQRTVYVWLKDQFGNAMTTPASASIQLDTTARDTTAPTGAVVINAGARLTASLAVSLQITGSDDSSAMCVSNTGDGCSSADAAFEAFATDKAWRLDGSGGDGQRTVYVWLRDSAGNTMSTPASVTIIVDSTPPSQTKVAFKNDAVLSSFNYVWAFFSAWDANGVAKFCYDFATPLVAAGCQGSWRTFNPNDGSAYVALPGSSGVKTIRAFFQDAGGNRSPVAAAASITLDVTPPSMSAVRVTIAESTPTSITMRWAGAAVDPHSGLVSYWLAYRADGGLPAPACRADGSTTRALVPTSATRATVGGLVAGNVFYRFRLCAVDKLGNVAAGVTGFGATS